MLLLFRWLCLLPITTILAAALPPAEESSLIATRDEYLGQVKVSLIDNETLLYNGYEVHKCGDYRDRNSKTTYVVGFLTLMRAELEKLVADAKLGTHSSHGFAAFFKSNRNINKVVRTLEPLIDAHPVLVSEERARDLPSDNRTPQPRLVCANEDDNDEFVALASAACKAKGGKAHDIPMLLSPGTEMIVICPDFWEVAHYPPPGQACPKTVKGKFKAGEVSLAATGYAYMVLNLVLMYTHETFGRSYTSGDVSSAVELNSRQSVLNPISYAYYAGAVQEGCTDFPRSKGRYDDLRL